MNWKPKEQGYSWESGLFEIFLYEDMGWCVSVFEGNKTLTYKRLEGQTLLEAQRDALTVGIEVIAEIVNKKQKNLKQVK